MTVLPSAKRSNAIRHTCAHSPRLALLPNKASLALHRPLRHTHNAPWTKTSSLVFGHFLWMSAISSIFSSLAKTTWRNPNVESICTFSTVRLSIWVLAWSGIGGRFSDSKRKSCTINASTWMSCSFQMSCSTCCISSSKTRVFTVT